MMKTALDAERKLTEMGLGDLPVAEVRAIPRPLPAGWFAAYRDARRELLTRTVQNNKDELFMMDIPVEFIMAMLRGERIPLNVSVKFKIPPIYGGSISAGNMFVCRAASEGRLIDSFIASQAGADLFFCPNPAKSVYITSMASMNSPGGNATSDRMSEVQASDVMNSIGGGRA
ncbi:MAG: hypothetical protein LBH81_00230 [Rickettsiales bacterium]|jgi:hypothetical protein|nr:hypothetical protein [Rickettsiales bacterium]